MHVSGAHPAGAAATCFGKTVTIAGSGTITGTTGNDVISMLKTTSLVAAIPLTTDLYGVARDISAVTYTPIPLLIVASLWYLLFTSLLMIGQYFLEKRFSRGINARRPDRGEPALATGALPAAGAPDGNDLGGKG